MKIRSVTGFIGCDEKTSAEKIVRLAPLLHAARAKLLSAGFEVQSTRAALPPVSPSCKNLIAFATSAESAIADNGIDYIALGVLPPELTAQIPQALAQTSRVFLSSPLNADDGMILRKALHPYAKIVLDLARLPADKFATLRYCQSAHCAPNIPFFPAAYAKAEDFSFSLAMECADVALDCARAACSLDEAQTLLASKIEEFARTIEPLMDGVAKEFGAQFHGCDWSLATHPDPECSVGAAIEALSGAPFGDPGTLSAVASLTRGLKSARVRHVGFSGVFLPLLEDNVLAQRTTEARFDLQTLLLYCTVCGAGLDTIPLAGDVSAESMAALLLDVATVASTHRKPLTVRFMPTDGLNLGSMTQFNFPFLVNAKTLKLAGGSEKLLR